MTRVSAIAAAASLLGGALLLGSTPAAHRLVTIVESQSYMGAHDMDHAWMEVAAGAGFDARIEPQSFLDGSFAGTDVLVLSSGVINLPAAREKALVDFLRGGGRVYLQAEYLESYETTAAFPRIVAALGGKFKWTEETHADLNPMAVLGRFGAGSPPVAPLSYFWHGVAGSGAAPAIEAFLRWEGKDYGFSFTPPASACALLVTTTDQDWVLKRTSPALMKSILAVLADRSGCQDTPKAP